MITARSLADILHKETIDESLPADASERLVHIVGILSLMQAVQNVGWTEHTNDWDWFLYVDERGGFEIEAWDWMLVDARWPKTAIPLDFVSDGIPTNVEEPRANALRLTGRPVGDEGADNDKEYIVLLRDITKIHIEEAH